MAKYSILPSWVSPEMLNASDGASTDADERSFYDIHFPIMQQLANSRWRNALVPDGAEDSSHVIRELDPRMTS